MKVSIIIPVYNTEKYLNKCLMSAVNQSYQDIEIIIIDDCSTDSSKDIIKFYEKNYKNIKVITHECNLGLSCSRNDGINLSDGKFLFFLDSDDYIDKDTIKKLVNAYKLYNTKIVQCRFRHMIGPVNISHLKNRLNHVVNIEENKEVLYNFNGVCWNKLYEHDFVGDLRFPDGMYYEDNAFVYPLLTKVKELAVIEEQLYTYRRNLGSITISNKFFPDERVLDFLTVKDVIISKCIEFGTYEEYKIVIDEIIKGLSISPFYRIETWYTMPFEKRKLLINLVYKYIQDLYQVEDIMDIKLVQMYAANDLRYRLRTKQLKKHLEEYKIPGFNEEDCLLKARKIIREFKKPSV